MTLSASILALPACLAMYVHYPLRGCGLSADLVRRLVSSLGSGSFHSSSQLVLADTADDGKSIVKARPHSQWGHNLGASGRAVSPLATRPSTSFVPTVAYSVAAGGPPGAAAVGPQNSVRECFDPHPPSSLAHHRVRFASVDVGSGRISVRETRWATSKLDHV
jgi:hypothetical protein